MASRSRQTRSAGPNLAPVFITIAGLVIAAVAVAVMQTKANEKAAAEAAAKESAEEDSAGPARNPFSDVDNSPKAFGAGARMTNDAPAGLKDGEPFVSAKKLGDEGLLLVASVAEARKKGDDATYRADGLKAQEKLGEAILLTTDWLMDLQDEYPNDRQIAEIEKETQRWQRGLQKVRKIK